MRLVITLMTKKKISKDKQKKIEKIFSKNVSSKYEIFEYTEENFCELDIDLFEVTFFRENIYDSMDMLIKLCESILVGIQDSIDFIIANDDTATEVERYVKDWNDVKDFGLFITQRIIPNLKPFHTSMISRAYLNFEHTSFGCVF
ncbi:hypothetical protein K7P65_002523 [Enterococcus faecalis]|uniref:hypothetical protein n=1 Tax=Enterococcus faecalis TaxID=1351 RepID=UPI00115DC3CC|nr:hypothetical protein [Enterococcus faecalis]EGO5829923.1 hypothetical protein [Enterococcus faecalis]EGO6036230.1 hypothetical protein [Enterococcus faecalis]EGO8155045.1 hypothetical protein [Enterococcus faecalis]EGO8859130.1 hypothetical protein [Enterococcus faecalis]EHH1655717.1 hypothetical protein [Enterococcus faecalis]